MKRLLLISLLGNLALFGLVAWRKSASVPLPVREARTESLTPHGTLTPPPARRITTGLAPVGWAKLETPDVRQFVANLRAIGCPEATIRDIVTLRICRRYRARLIESQAEMYGRLTESQNLDRADWKKLRDINQALRDEMHDELESVLGADWGTLTAGLTSFPQAEDNVHQTLSAEQRSQLRAVKGKFRSELQELEEKRLLGTMEPEDAAALRRLEQEQQTALAAVLSPQQLEEYLYRDSAAADYVRRTLPEAKNEAEYRAMVKLALEMQMSPTLDAPQRMPGLDADSDETKLTAQQRREEYDRRLKELLGSDRIAEQEAETQARHAAEAKADEEKAGQQMQQQLTDAATAAGVSAENAKRFYDRLRESEADLRKKFEAQEKSLSGTPEEKAAQMRAAVTTELNRLALETIGEKGPAVVEKMLERGR